MTDDPYTDPATGVLLNRLGITDPMPAACSNRWRRNVTLRDLPRETFVDRLTYYVAEVNAIHPFREGNGRTQRAFFHQLCRDAGWPIDWSGLRREENEHVSVASLRGRSAPLRQLLDALVAG